MSSQPNNETVPSSANDSGSKRIAGRRIHRGGVFLFFTWVRVSALSLPPAGGSSRPAGNFKCHLAYQHTNTGAYYLVIRFFRISLQAPGVPNKHTGSLIGCPRLVWRGNLQGFCLVDYIFRSAWCSFYTILQVFQLKKSLLFFLNVIH